MSETWQAGDLVQGPSERYRLERPLGEGGFATTWLAKRVSDDLPVAMKSLHFRRLSDWKSLELFERETRVLRRLDHPQIPNYVDDFKLGDDPIQPEGLVLVQQFVDGAPLSEAVAGRMAMDEARLVAWLAQLLDVLHYLHSQTPPVIHRDVTPKNVLLDTAGKAWLVDFGTVQAAVRSATDLSSTSAGTFGFAPMEQFVGAAFPSSDLYGLAMTALAVASGKNPTDMPFAGVRVDVRALVQVDARLTLLLERMTEPDPERRMNDARLALAQLRPLVHRLASRDTITAAAMQAVAERARGSLPVRSQGAEDDLLPSERMREAGLRMATVAGQALPIPPLGEHFRWARRAAVSRSGDWLGVGRFVLDARDLRVVGKLRDEHSTAAFNVAGDRLVACDEGSWRDGHLHVYERSGGALSHLVHIETGIDDPALALSPDGRTLCATDESQTLLYDTTSGAQTQKVPGTFHDACFTADGSGLILVNRDKDAARLLRGDGSEVKLSAVAVATCSVDGAWIALLGTKGVALHPGDDPGRRDGRRFGPTGVTWRDAAFSPDGRWLVAYNYSRDVLELFDVEQRRRVGTLRDPNQPQERLGSVLTLGFSASGDRLFAACRLAYNRYVKDTDRCLATWSMPDRTYLGCVALDDNRKGPLLVSARGYYGAAPKRPAKTSAGKTSAGKTSAAKRRSKGNKREPWRQPEVALGGLLGRPVEELLDDQGRAQLADVEARWRFVEALQAAGTLDPEAAPADVVDATRGVTHVLDQVVRDARAAQRGVTTFGGGAQGVALTVDQVRAAADTLRARGSEELQAVHTQLLAEAEAAELAEAEQVSRRQVRRPPARREATPGVPPAPAPTEALSPHAEAALAARQRKLVLWVALGAIAGLAASIVAVLL